tara:strand:- start:645 stop:1817 length:1173 start_codon:yes stop_codon:yes gene_type:complete
MKFPSISLSREWKELKKFESLESSVRSIVFYAENKASMNHFKSLIDELTESLGREICYITSNRSDPILTTKNNKIHTFYVGSGTARDKLFLSLKADVLVTDMPDLETYHIKRSKTHPVHYVYVFHSMFSIHSYLRKGALDNYDTIFCVGQHHVNEIRETEKVYGLKSKNLINYGYGRLDTLLQERENFQRINHNTKDLIIIAPSYGNNNLLEKCGPGLIAIFLKLNFKVMLRPHFITLRDSTKLIDSIKEKFGKNRNFVLERDIIPSDSFHNSLFMISDWSGISLEYAFALERPVLFVDVPKKINNPDFEKIHCEIIETNIRREIGYVISPNELERIPEKINSLLQNLDKFRKKIRKIRSKTVFNIGKSAIMGAKHIIKIADEHKEINKL